MLCEGSRVYLFILTLGSRMAGFLIVHWEGSSVDKPIVLMIFLSGGGTVDKGSPGVTNLMGACCRSGSLKIQKFWLGVAAFWATGGGDSFADTAILPSSMKSCTLCLKLLHRSVVCPLFWCN